MHGRYVTDILKMCMNNFNAEKIILTSTNFSQILPRTAELAALERLKNPIDLLCGKFC